MKHRQQYTMPSDRMAAVVIVLVIGAVFGVSYQVADERVFSGPDIGEYGTSHAHLYFNVVLAGEELDMGQSQFLQQADRVHFHNPDNILHIHADGMTLGFTLRTLGLQIEDSCLAVNGTEYCGNETHSFQFYANGEQISSYRSYEPDQGDTLVMFFGPDDAAPADEYFEQELPESLQPDAPGRGV